jgi:hypothetical protein
MSDKSELAQSILFAGAGIILGTAVAAMTASPPEKNELKQTSTSEKHVGF